MPQTVGLVGGLGPLATIDYYQRLIAGWSGRNPNSAPHIIIDSLDPWRVLRLAADDRGGLVEYILASVLRLKAGGAGFVAITSATTHLAFEGVAPRAGVPMLSLVECCADAAARNGWRKLLLLGSRFAMSSALFPDVFVRRGMQLVAPDTGDQEWFHDRYVNQLVKGDFRDETREEFTALVRKLHQEHHVDAVILGGTELPLLLKEPTIAGVPVLDATAVHVAQILDRMTS